MRPSHFVSPVLILLVAGFAAQPRACAAADSSPTTKPAPYEKTITAWEKADRAKPPPANANLFIGSSSITKWKSLADDFPGIPVINRGFGGSRIPDATKYASRIVIPYHPKRIFLYSGDNDVASGSTPEKVLENYKAFVETVRGGLPDEPIYFISIKPSPARAKLLEKARAANQLVEAWSKEGKNLYYVDVFTSMLGADGKARAELFGPDKLHMNHTGYEIWIAKLMPLMK